MSPVHYETKHQNVDLASGKIYQSVEAATQSRQSSSPLSTCGRATNFVIFLESHDRGCTTIMTTHTANSHFHIAPWVHDEPVVVIETLLRVQRHMCCKVAR